MRRVLPYMAVVLAYIMTPAIGEITENVVHVFTEGHTAHAMADQEHEPRGDEHGCSASFHFCSCHGSVTFLPSAAVRFGHGVRGSAAPVARDVPEALPSGYLVGIFRPPIESLYS